MSDLRCPRCGAVRRAGDQWCGMCYADFREPPPAVVGDGTAPTAPAAAPAPAPGEVAPPLIRPPGQAVPPGQPVPAAQPVPAIPTQTAAPAPGPAAPFVPSTNPLAPAPTMPTQLPAGVAPAAPADPAVAPTPTVPGADPDSGKTWPCTRCGSDVPISEDICPACGAGFLAGASNSTSVKVPLLGDVGKLDSGQKLLFGVCIAVGIILGIVALLFIGGHVFK